MEDPYHSVRVVEGGAPSGRDLLIVSGEEHDQGIRTDSYHDAYGRYKSVMHAANASVLPQLLVHKVVRVLAVKGFRYRQIDTGSMCRSDSAFAQALVGHVTGCHKGNISTKSP